MARASKRRRRLWDTYSFSGFRAEPIVRGIFGDPKACIVTLKRRSKKRHADGDLALRRQACAHRPRHRNGQDIRSDGHASACQPAFRLGFGALAAGRTPALIGTRGRPRLPHALDGECRTIAQYKLTNMPAHGPKALKRISRDIRSWALHHRSDKSLTELAQMYNPASAAGSPLQPLPGPKTSAAPLSSCAFHDAI